METCIAKIEMKSLCDILIEVNIVPILLSKVKFKSNVHHWQSDNRFISHVSGFGVLQRPRKTGSGSLLLN